MSKIEVNAIEPQCGTTLTLGANNDKITLGTGASFGGGVAAIKWETTAQSGDFGALSGRGYFVNTTSGARTVTLPASPSAGDIVYVKDYTGNFGTNACTVARNGSNIRGGTNNFLLQKNNSGAVFVYVDGTEGWQVFVDGSDVDVQKAYIEATGGTIVTCGDYKTHIFTGPGTFTVCALAGCATQNIVSYVIVGGGDAGGGGAPFGGTAAGGGGAGGFREVKNTDVDTYNDSPLNGYCTPANRVTVTAQGYPIIVGGGGTPGISVGQGASGSNSSFGGITGAGGGGGGGATSNNGANGGSGGGKTSGGTAGSGNSPPVSPPQGQNGGSYGPGGGGGGATQAGFGQDSPFNKDGGAGATSSINGTPTARAGGGGGGGGGAPIAGGGAGGSGGTGGGGAGAPSPSGCNSTAGTVNTGGGGGGGPVTDCSTSGAGGSGIVIIRYKFQ